MESEDQNFEGSCPTCGQKYLGWQPIETAPKDGSLIDLWFWDKRVVQCSWIRHNPDYEQMWCFFDQREGWKSIQNIGSVARNYRTLEPTHWMRVGPP